MSESMVKVVPTPNPDAYMFRVFENLVATGTYEFLPNSDLSSSPLAQKIFTLDDVALILITPRFITIRKHPESDWHPLTSRICDLLIQFLSASEMAVFETPQTKTLSSEARSEVEQKILELLEEEVRPAHRDAPSPRAARGLRGHAPCAAAAGAGARLRRRAPRYKDR